MDGEKLALYEQLIAEFGEDADPLLRAQVEKAVELRNEMLAVQSGSSITSRDVH